MRTGLSFIAASSVLFAPMVARAQATAFSDQLVQGPEIDPPSRGAVAGQYAAVSFGPGDLARGTYTLPLPIVLPSDRGHIGASPVPGYSVDVGVTEWGVGWSAPNLQIFRSRVAGDLDYATDDLTGPWGRMIRGSDGAFYPDGLPSMVRMVESGNELVAYLPDGSVWTFAAADGIVTTLGTYAWGLQSVVSILGRTTTYVYTHNASGRPYLSTVTYGGTTPGAPEYEVALTYAPLAVPLPDYRSGQDVLLDQRVASVQLRALENASFVPRHTWNLTYTQDGTGPAFYLASLQQTFVASGQVAPASTFTYSFAGAYLSQLTAQPVTKVAATLSAYGAGVILPNISTPVDIDLDGRPDLEFQYDGRILQQTSTGFTDVPLPATTSTTNPVCRPAPSALNAPRTLARMVPQSTEVHVVSLTPSASGTQTQLVLCDRPGDTLWQTTLTGDWKLGSNTRLVDLNRDHLPDLVRVYAGGYQAIANENTASGYGVGAVVTGTLSPVVTMDTSWVHDMNGDGIPDLVSRWSGGVVVWFGEGRFTFNPTGLVLPIFTSKGLAVGNLSSYEFVFFDANNDGLADLLLANGASISLYTNTGTSFVQVSVPLFSSTTFSQVEPIPLDMAGNGNTEIAYTQKGAGYAVDVDGPGVGLLASASDGQGTTLQFTYQRANPEVGVRYRNSLLSSLSITSVGSGTNTYDFAFATPDLHSVGLFLLGYQSVTRTGALDTTSVSFLNTDDSPGTILQEIATDSLAPSVERVRSRTYSSTAVLGIPWLRPAADQKAWSSTGTPASTIADTTTYETYENGVCPVATTEITSAGTLTTSTQLASIAAFDNGLACLPSSIVMSGAHANAALNFTHEVNLARNAAGQVTGVTLVGVTGDTLPEETVTYGANGTVSSVTTAGHGTTTYAYVAGTEMLSQVTTPDGVVETVSARDPLSDAMEIISTNRGGMTLLQSFTYDGRERLATSYDNLGQATAAVPSEKFSYADPTATTAGYFETDTLLDEPSATYRAQALLYTARGETIASAHAVPQGWAFDSLVGRVASARQTTTYTHPSYSGVLSALPVSTLLGGGQAVKTIEQSSWGDTVASAENLGVGIARSVASTLAVHTTLTSTNVENGTLATVSGYDDKRNRVSDTNEAGAVTSYGFDALGRARSVVLADGTNRQIGLDEFGRVSSIVHSDVGTVGYVYQSGTGLLSEKTFSSPAGAVLRESVYAYDSIGRLTTETDTDVASKSTETSDWYYDGVTSTSTAARGQALGLLTGVSGPSYTRATTYRPDGSISSSVVSLAGQRTITTTKAYFEDGSTRSRTTTVANASGSVLVSSVEGSTVDSHGRVSGTTLDGNPVATYAYDGNGLPLSASYAAPTGSGQVVTLTHDPLTYAQSAIGETAGPWTASYSRVLNARANVDHEVFGLGSATTTRQYAYAAPPFLASSSDATSTYSYAYGTTGLPSSIVSTISGAVDSRVFQRTGDQLVAGTHQESFDALGRAVSVDSSALTYGGNGQVVSATTPTGSFTYLYDEKGHRVAKLSGGTIEQIFMPDGSTVSTTARVEPIQFAGTTVGTLSHPLGGGAKTFSLVAVDARGTSLSDAQGVARPASPFGDRVTHPNVAATVDYASSRFDSDLGLIRMGLRDYDPHLSRFTTPDPLVIEDLGKCRGHAVDCTLYAYARNNPLVVVDPSGQWGFSLGAGGTAAAGVGPGVGFTVEFGVLVDVSNLSLTPYGTFGGVLPWSQGAVVFGASAGLSASANIVSDTSQFFGNSTQLSLATGVAVGGQAGLTNGDVNSAGLSYGKLAAGVSYSAMNTVTLDMNPFNAQEVQYAPGDPNAGNAYPPGEQQGESAPAAPSPTDSAPGAAPGGASQDDAPNFTPATQDSSALTCSDSDDGGGD